MLNKRKNIGYKYNQYVLCKKVKGLSSLSPLARQIIRDIFDKIWVSENLEVEEDELLISYLGITKSKWKTLKSELISLNKNFISFNEKNKTWTSKWLNKQNSLLDDKPDFIDDEKENIFNQVDNKLIEINRISSNKTTLRKSETVYDRSKFIEYELKNQKNNIDGNKEMSKDEKQLMDIAIKSFIKLNKVFNSLYLDAWTKNASEEEFREFWINDFFNKKVTENDIDTIVGMISKKEEFSMYPPNLASFNSLFNSILMEKHNIPSKEEAFRLAYGNNKHILMKSHPVVLETIRVVQDFRIMSDPYIKKEFFETYENIAEDFIKNPNSEKYKKIVLNEEKNENNNRILDKNQKLNMISKIFKE